MLTAVAAAMAATSALRQSNRRARKRGCGQEQNGCGEGAELGHAALLIDHLRGNSTTRYNHRPFQPLSRMRCYFGYWRLQNRLFLAHHDPRRVAGVREVVAVRCQHPDAAVDEREEAQLLRDEVASEAAGVLHEHRLDPVGLQAIQQGREAGARLDRIGADEADEHEIREFEAMRELELEAPRLSPASVRWNPKDDEQPDYRHLDTSLAATTFEFTSADLDLLIQANEFSVRPGKVVFALRGAALQGGKARENVTSIIMTDQRPDHQSYRCIIGACDRATGRLWAYPASTVPNAFYVHKCFAMAKAGTPISGLTGNILPTGCYTYAIGTHKRGKRGEIPGVLRLSTTATGASQVVVLRSVNDVVYDRFDRFPIATPADNIHPGILGSSFSSAGCLTIPGRFAAGRHEGFWSDFRKALRMDTAGDGTQFSMVLVTGLDAAIAADVRMRPGEAGRLARLRHGSKGPRVAALQAALGLAPDSSQLMGPVTRSALAVKQAAVIGWSDGVYSPAMDQLLGFNVYAVS
jgi:hypothetical protein